MSEAREAARSGALTRKQTALIHVARKQLVLSDERYRYILRKMAGVESAKDLDQTGFELVMKAMMALGFRSDFTRTFYTHRAGMATPAQVTRIRALWGEFATVDDSGTALNRWLERTFKVSALRFVTEEQAAKAIRALRAMNRKAKTTAPGSGPRAAEIVRWRHAVIREALGHPPRSRARVEAIARAARIAGTLPSGRRGPVAESTIRRWIAAFERNGMAGLEPKRSGRRRVARPRARARDGTP